jgi:NAD(P)-dependent dehydrogenase (short-subunit alcohol dehydrogenase family)
MKLNGKVAWVVGASSGIGAAVARELACRGGTVAISARREEQLREVSEGHMLVVPLDVTDAASVAAAAARVHQELGPIDLAVLSAGYWKQMNPADWDTDLFNRHVRVNLAGMSNAIAAVLPGMLRRHHGVIAGIASVSGYRGLAGAEPTVRPRRPRSTCSSRCASTSPGPACRSRLSAPASSGPASRLATASPCPSSSMPARPHDPSATDWNVSAPRSSSPPGWLC